MLPRPTRSVPTATSAPQSEFVTGLIELETTGHVTTGSDVIGRADLPDFLFEDDPTPIEEAPAAVEERWSEPFASGVALSDKLLSHGRPTPAPIDNLPHSSMRRGRNSRSAG